MTKTTFALFLCFALTALGCSSTPASTAKPSCEEIYEACHPVDPGAGEIHECHENSELASRTEAQCAADKTACLAVCNAAPRDGGASDGAAGDAR